MSKVSRSHKRQGEPLGGIRQRLSGGARETRSGTSREFGGRSTGSPGTDQSDFSGRPPREHLDVFGGAHPEHGGGRPSPPIYTVQLLYHSSGGAKVTDERGRPKNLERILRLPLFPWGRRRKVGPLLRASARAPRDTPTCCACVVAWVGRPRAFRLPRPSSPSVFGLPQPTLSSFVSPSGPGFGSGGEALASLPGRTFAVRDPLLRSAVRPCCTRLSAAPLRRLRWICRPCPIRVVSRICAVPHTCPPDRIAVSACAGQRGPSIRASLSRARVLQARINILSLGRLPQGIAGRHVAGIPVPLAPTTKGDL